MQAGFGDEKKDAEDVKEGRDLNLIMLFSQIQKGEFFRCSTMPVY